MWNVRWPAVALAALVLSGLGCGGDGGDDGSDDVVAQGGGAGSGAGMPELPAGSRIVASTTPPRAGECQSSANCTGAAGTPACATVAGAYRVCTYQPQDVTTASTSTLDECDSARPCASGSKCNSVLSFPSGQCGTTGAQTRNMCRKSTCASDADCPEGVCGPTGFASENLISGGAIRQCIKAACKSSAECTAKAGGTCALVQPGCVKAGAQGAQSFYPGQLACVYSDGCTNSSSNCPSNSICKVVDGKGVCITQ